MTVIKETKHILDNLFNLQPDSKFYAYLLENSKLGLGVMDYVIIGKELRGENGSCFEMSDYEANLLDQLDDYEAFCYDNQFHMDTKFPLLECTKKDFDRFKRGSLNCSCTRGPPNPHRNSSSTMGGPPEPSGNSSSSIESYFNETFHNNSAAIHEKDY